MDTIAGSWTCDGTRVNIPRHFLPRSLLGEFVNWIAAGRCQPAPGVSGLEKGMLDGVGPVEAAIRYFRARLPCMEYAARHGARTAA